MILGILSAVALSSPAVWHDANRTQRTWFGFDTTGLTTVTDFNVLITVPAGTPLLSAPVGELRILDASGTQLDFDAERWSAAGGELWVEVPEVTGGSTTGGVYLYSGQVAVDSLGGPVGAQAWSSDYRGIWHFGAGSPNESLGRATSVLRGSAAGAAGRIGGGFGFNGLDTYIEVTSPESDFDILTESVTVSAWVRATALDINWQAIVTKGDDTYRLHRDNWNSRVAFSVNTPSSSNEPCGSTLPLGSWVLLHGVYNRGNGKLRVYQNGARCGSQNENGNVQDRGHPLMIGANAENLDRLWNGDLDEVRVIAAARGDNWIEAEYRNQSGGMVSIDPTCVRGTDGDADGIPCEYDCDDTDGTVKGAFFPDVDSDGVGVEAGVLFRCFGGGDPAGHVEAYGDCSPNDDDIFPGNPEVCDGKDNDCDGDIDGGAVDGVARFVDADRDGFGVGPSILVCDLAGAYATVDGDCDDTHPGVYPMAPERCDVLDRDCDNDGFLNAVNMNDLRFPDTDGDGYGAGTAVFACALDDRYSDTSDDCRPNLAAGHPNATETCDDVDMNCDGDAFAGATTNLVNRHPDLDGDGFGAGPMVPACPLDPSYSEVSGDCGPQDAAVFPGAVETCDVVDQNCDGDPFAGAVDLTTVYVDHDGDDYGTGAPLQRCLLAGMYAALDGDCDDTDDETSPHAQETCEPVDRNCDLDLYAGAVDAALLFVDHDGDGFGGPSQMGCIQQPLLVDLSGDCEDDDALINPLATELCDGVDRNCDGRIPEIASGYLDADGDGYGVDPFLTDRCSDPLAPVNGDCLDDNSDVNPGATDDPNTAFAEDCSGPLPPPTPTGDTGSEDTASPVTVVPTEPTLPVTPTPTGEPTVAPTGLVPPPPASGCTCTSTGGSSGWGSLVWLLLAARYGLRSRRNPS